MRRHLFADALRLLGAGMALLVAGILLRPLVADALLQRLAVAVSVLGLGLCIGPLIAPIVGMLPALALCLFLRPMLATLLAALTAIALAYLLP